MNNRKTHVQRKVMTGEEAAGLIRNGAVVWLSGGGGGINDPDYLLGCIEARFLREGAPSGLVLYLSLIHISDDIFVAGHLGRQHQSLLKMVFLGAVVALSLIHI